MAGFLDTQSGANQTEALYVAYFSRAGDGPGYLYWTNQLASEEAGGTPASVAVVNVADAFAVQPEAKAAYSFLASPPTTLSTTDPVQIAGVDSFINQVYENLFNRAADSTGLNYWQTQILSGAVSVGSAVYAIANGAQGGDQAVLADKIVAAQFFTTQTYSANLVSGNAFLAAAHAAIAPVQDSGTLSSSETFTTQFVTSQGTASTALTLTPGADALSTSTAGAVFNAPLVNTSTQVAAQSFNIQTLSVNDTLNDSSGGGILNATLNTGLGVGPTIVPNVTMIGIQTANLTNLAGATNGFSGNISGLTTVNVNNSNAGITVGAVGDGLKTALTNVSVAGFTGGNGSALFTGIIGASVGSASNTIAISLSGLLGATGQTPGGVGLADSLTFETDGPPGTKTSPNISYGTWAITANSNANLQLQEGGVGGATTLNISGAGNVAVGQDVAGNWQNLKTINASGSTGNVTITGSATTVASNAAASPGNPGGLSGSAQGLLTGNTSLTSYSLSGGAGVNVLDVSSFTTAAELATLTTVAGTNTATTNEIIVTSANADATAASTWAGIKGFQILGDVGPGGDTGVMNLANLPSSINDVLYQTAAVGNLSIENLPTTFTVDTEGNGQGFALTVGAVGPAGGVSDSFTLIVGSTTFGVNNGPSGLVGTVGNVTMIGEEIVTLTAQGPSGVVDTVGFMSLTPTVTGNEKVTIGGAEALTIGNTSGAIADINPGSTPASLFANNMTVTITDTKVVTLDAATAAGALLSAAPLGNSADAGAPVNSINALTLDAHTSGGLIMAGGDANYTSSTTAGGSIGDTILGSTTAGNVLGGSIGNDTITGTSSTTAADTIYTSGGADAISLAAGHTASDHVDLYATSGAGTPAPGFAVAAVANSIVDAHDVPQLGWWGQGTGQTGGAVSNAATNLGTATGVGINGSLSTVANFVPGSAATPQDVVDISTGAFSGLLHDAGTGAALIGAPATTFSMPTAPGANLPLASANVLVLSGTFSGAAGLVSSLAGAGTAIHFGTPVPVAAGVGDHFIVAYQDSGSSSVHIADLDIHSTAATITSTAGGGGETVALSDLVQLTGVAVTSLHTGNIHFVA